MIRILIRTIGYLLLAGAFVAVVVDGTRSIASSAWQITSVQAFVERIWPNALPALKALAQPLHPLLWEPGLTTAIRAPLAALLLVLGIILVVLAAPREPDVGYLARR